MEQLWLQIKDASSARDATVVLTNYSTNTTGVITRVGTNQVENWDVLKQINSGSNDKTNRSVSVGDTDSATEIGTDEFDGIVIYLGHPKLGGRELAKA